MNTAKVRIDHTQIGKDLKEHLNIDGNKRILFSGPFGTGKSTFLREFFSEDKNNFFTLTLNPINYSIASNEDVFEWVKYDLLIELINNHASELDLTKEEFPTLLISQFFILERFKMGSNFNSTASTFYPLLGISEKIGKPIIEVLKLIEEFNAYRDKKEFDEGKLIHNYIKALKALSGSPYEKDAISAIISSLIDRLKKKVKKEKVESVLIIDDLDRLDPDHMFRLFNIFSSHYDINDNNKFGFNKVIFVCDVENIRNIFHYRYGTDVDFNGYIDKFYSREVFHFNNRRLIKDFIKEVVPSLPYNSEEFRKLYPLGVRDLFYQSLELILQSLIDIRALNLRMLVQYHVIKIPTYSFSVREVHDELLVQNYPAVVIFELLKGFYPSYEVVGIKLKQLAESFNKGLIATTKQNISDLENVERAIASYCLPFLIARKQAFDNDTMYELTKSIGKHRFVTKDQCVLHYRYHFKENRRFEYILWVDKITSVADEELEETINMFELLYSCFTACRNLKIF
ncbi:P-loop NTPase fold protein [Paraflavisolibacter sp. H34]|uniref:P-loop NTPase fold protein n=1 Tax=Huijunlia imazamoxiresistens TaxID=3127457 RepID=UPI0030189ECA